MVGIWAVVGGRVGGWVGAGTIKEKQGQNKSHNILTQSSCVTSRLRTATLLYSRLVQSDSQTVTECADRVQLCLPRWLGSSLNHWPVTAAAYWHTDVLKHCSCPKSWKEIYYVYIFSLPLTWRHFVIWKWVILVSVSHLRVVSTMVTAEPSMFCSCV